MTTASPDALRKYSQAIRAFDLRDYDRAIPLLEETIAIDTTFAMAYRKLAVALNNSGGAESRSDAAATKAFENRDRLPDVERYLTIAQYYWQVEQNRDEVRTAFLNVLDLDPDNLTALNNLALLMNQMNEPEEAERYAMRGLEAGMIPVLYSNAVRAQVRQGAFDRADSTVSRFETTSPGHPAAALLRGAIISAQRDFDGAEAHYQRLRDEFATRRSSYIPVLSRLRAISQAQGQIATAERYGRELLAMAEESDEPDDYIVRTIFLAWYDLAYRDAPPEGLSKVEAALERYPLESMPLLDRPYLTLAGFYVDAGQQNRAQELVDAYEHGIDESLRRSGLDELYEVKGRIALADGQFEDAIGWFRQEAAQERCLDCGDFDFARAYDRAGETDSALVEYERLISRPTVNRVFNDAFTLAPSYKRVGELYEERDEIAKAVEYYNNFVELWSDADPELQDQVQDVRERIARLVGER